MLRLCDGCGGDEGVGEDARGSELGGDAAGDVAVLALHVPEIAILIYFSSLDIQTDISVNDLRALTQMQQMYNKNHLPL